MELLGVSISHATRQEILERIEAYLTEPQFHRIATVNPEFLVLATKNQAFKESLNQADLCIADGFGIVLAGWWRRETITRFPGADLLKSILHLAEEKSYTVFLALKEDGLSSSEEIKEVLFRKHPSLRITTELKQAEIIFCNFGAPTQELYLEGLRNNPGYLRLAIGVGGSFDYLTGKLRRAPRIMRFLGLEWFWRLLLQPKRFKRIWNAVVMFPVEVLRENKTRLS